MFLHSESLEKLKFQIWEIQTYFLLIKVIQIKIDSTTKLYSFGRSTTFILVIYLSGTVVVILFTNLLYLSYTFMKLLPQSENKYSSHILRSLQVLSLTRYIEK
jgi:hypothetical protein